MMCLSLISLPLCYYYFLYNQATPSQACSVVRIVGSEEMSPWLVPPAGDRSLPGVVAGCSRAVALLVSPGERTRRPAVTSLQRECLAWTCLARGMWDTHSLTQPELLGEINPREPGLPAWSLSSLGSVDLSCAA